MFVGGSFWTMIRPSRLLRIFHVFEDSGRPSLVNVCRISCQ